MAWLIRKSAALISVSDGAAATIKLTWRRLDFRPLAVISVIKRRRGSVDHGMKEGALQAVERVRVARSHGRRAISVLAVGQAPHPGRILRRGGDLHDAADQEARREHVTCELDAGPDRA